MGCPALPASAPCSLSLVHDAAHASTDEKRGIAEENKAQNQNPRPIENKEGEMMGRKRTSAGQRVRRRVRMPPSCRSGLLRFFVGGGASSHLRVCDVGMTTERRCDARSGRGPSSRSRPYTRRRCRHPGCRDETTRTKFFGSWFFQDDGADASHGAPLETDGSAPRAWADYTDNDGSGDLPAGWAKAESERSLSPVDSGIDFSFENLMREITNNLSAEDKQKIVRREAKMRNAHLKQPASVSDTSNQTKSKSSKSKSSKVDRDRISIHAVHMQSDAGPSKNKWSQPSHTAPSTPRIPAAAKGKGRDFSQGPSITREDAYVSESEIADDDARQYQLKVDALLAMKLQQQLNAEDERPGTENEHFVPHNTVPTSRDFEIAEALQKLFDKQHARIRKLERESEAAKKPERHEPGRNGFVGSGRNPNLPAVKTGNQKGKANHLSRPVMTVARRPRIRIRVACAQVF
ncbi:hypothetical protein DFH09DRAFT_1087492 [Mycena vulgaris]|nr:hypothetical protein DFH09DRAFT_1087492 [Mycena vulgaris]